MQIASDGTINNRKQISFPHFQYNGRRHQKLKSGWAGYVCSHWMPVWNSGYYYLLSHTEKHGVTSFRGDCIAAARPRGAGKNLQGMIEIYLFLWGKGFI